MSTRAVPVFYTPRMVAPSTSFSPSAQKPAQVVESWRKLGVALDWREPAPATVAELSAAHDEAFVHEVLSTKRANGFGDRSPEVALSLPYTSGAMLSAARFVLVEKRPVAAAPCSGFHHAGFASSGGFCTFNGLMVTACALHAIGVGAVGILDCDMHWGDGTEDIIDKLDARAWVRHVDVGGRYNSKRDAAPFLRDIPVLFDEMKDCDIVLYQAGADPHVDDPLGGWLTTDELAQRDAAVFDTARARGMPLVWNLAGGYQREPDGSIPKVLAIHDNTMRACAATFLG